MKQLLAFVFLCLWSGAVLAQTCTVTGHVDAPDLGSGTVPAAGVTVTVVKVEKEGALLRGLSRTTQTDNSGNFSLVLPASSRAWVSIPVPGYNTQGGVELAVPAAGQCPAVISTIRRESGFKLQPVIVVDNSGGGGGSGTVTAVTAGNASPLFTSSVANGTTTPALLFTRPVQNANKLYAGPPTGADAAPTFRLLVPADIPDLLAVYAATGHTHSFASITSKPTTLAGYGISDAAALAHVHAAADVTSGVLAVARGGTGTGTATNNAVLVGDGSAWGASVIPSCSNGTTDKLLYNNSTRTFTCGSDQTGAGGSGITTLGGQTGTTQTFGKTDDTNVTLTITSNTNNHQFALGWAGTLAAGRLNSNVVQAITNDTNIQGSISAQNLTLAWAGTLAKARQNAATVYNDAANTFSTGLQDFSAATFKAPITAGYAPTVSGLFGYDSTANLFKGGANGSAKTFLFSDGDGASLTNLNASNLASGTVPLARLSGITTSQLSGSAGILNAQLANSTIGIAGNSTALGASVTQDQITGLSSTGIVKRTAANTLAIAVAGTDYAAATSGSGILKGNGSGGFSTATAGTDYVSPFSTETLTNKTIDVEDTGNVFKTTAKIWIPAAGCNNTTAATIWDLPTSNAASATCRTPSANTQRGLLDFAAGATNIAFNTIKLPSDWITGAGVDAEILWQSTTTSGNVVWEISLACAGDGDADDVTVSYQSFSADAAKGTANQLNSATKTNITTTGTCAAGDLMTIAVRRQAGTGSDTMATNPARLVGVELTYRSSK